MIKVLEKSDNLLELISRHAPVSFTDLQARSGMNKATLSQILKSMVQLGWLQRDDKGLFRIGPRIEALSADGGIGKKFRNACIKALEDLSQEINETFTIAVIHNGRRKVIAKREADHLVQVNESTSSAPESMFATATGLLLLASLEPGERDKFVADSGLDAKYNAVSDKLSSFETNGYATLAMGNNDSLAIAVAVKDSEDKIVAALGLSVPCYRFDGDVDSVVELLNKYAAMISKNAGI